MFATSGDPCGWDKNILRDWIDDRERVPAQDQQARSERGIAVSFDQRHGKGSHGTLRFGNRKTTLKDLRKEIGVGLLHVMLGQLGLSRGDLDK